MKMILEFGDVGQPLYVSLQEQGIAAPPDFLMCTIR